MRPQRPFLPHLIGVGLNLCQVFKDVMVVKLLPGLGRDVRLEANSNFELGVLLIVWRDAGVVVCAINTKTGFIRLPALIR